MANTKPRTISDRIAEWRRDCTDAEIIAWAMRAQHSCILQDAQTARAALAYLIA